MRINQFPKFALPLLVVLFSLIQKNHAQVSINNTGAAPDASAMLDINANNKGILLPRVELQSNADATTVPMPAQYLIIYNTNASMSNGLRGPGMYANTGTALAPAWQKAATGATGVEGPQGPVGPQGPKGNTGASGSHISSGFIGGFVSQIDGGSAAYVFLNPANPITKTVTTTASQRILLWGNIPIGMAAGAPLQVIEVGAGYQSTVAGSPILNMAGANITTLRIGSKRENIAFTGSIVPGAGTWKIGPVVKNIETYPIWDNSYANAIYMVVEE